MKKISHLISLFPCRSLEDFPTDGSKEDARGLLMAWTGLFHPALISHCGKAPQWRPAADTVSSDEEAQRHRDEYIQQHYYDDDAADHSDGGGFQFEPDVFEERWKDSLVVIPQPSSFQVYEGFWDLARAAGAQFVTSLKSRSRWLEEVGVESDIDPELIADFFSLGYVRLQVEMMTQKLRFSSDLDCERFDAMVVAAANDAVAGNDDAAKKALQAAFDQLAEEKNRYYPVAADFVDLVMVADSIRTKSVDAELDSDCPKCFLISGAAIRSLAERSAATIQSVAKRVEDESVGIVCGPEHELPDNLLSTESVLNQIKLARLACEEHFGITPNVFMRRRFGLNASLPGILEGLGFRGAVHGTFDAGTIPKTFSNTIRWMGVDGGTIMAMGETH